MPPEINQEQVSETKSFNFLETDPKKNFAPWFLIFCAVLIVIGLSVAGYFKYQAKQSYYAGMEFATEAVDEFAGWETYENEELGFSFKYPANYGNFEFEILGEDEFGFRTGKQFIGNFSNNDYLSIGGVTEDHAYPRGSYFFDFARFSIENDRYYHVVRPDYKKEIVPTNIAEVSGQQVLFVEVDSYIEELGSDGPGIRGGGALVNLPYGNEFKGLAIGKAFLNPVPEEEFKKIVSTLEFFEPSDTSDWQTYRNEEFGFEFRYPKDWKEETESLMALTREFEKVDRTSGHDLTGFCKVIFSHSSRLTSLTLFPEIVEDVMSDARLFEEIGEGMVGPTSSVNVSGREGVKYSWSTILVQNAETYIIPLNNRALVITIICGNDVVDKGKEVVTQILSTFRFLD